MSLYTKWRFPRIALKPIKCYKIVTTYRGDIISLCLGYKLKKYNVDSLFPILGRRLSKNLYVVGEGYFHAITTEGRAKDTSRDIYPIVECIIPRFSLYYISCDGMEVCSKWLICKLLTYYHYKYTDYVTKKDISKLR